MENTDILQENTMPDAPAPAETAPWYCVLPVAAFGVLAPLLPDCSSEDSMSLFAFLAVAMVSAAFYAAFKGRISFRFRPVQIAAAVLAIAALYLGNRMMVCCAVLLITASGLRYPAWGVTFTVWAAALAIAARGFMQAIGFFTDPIRTADILLLAPGAAMIFILLAGSLGRKSVSAGTSALIFWLMLAVLIAAAARADLIAFSIGLAACIIVMAVIHLRLAARWIGALMLLIAASVIVLAFSWNTWKPAADEMLRTDLPEAAVKDIITEGNTAVFTLEDGTVLKAVTESDEAGNITRAEFYDGEDVLLPLIEDENSTNLFIIDQEPYQSCFRLCIIKDNNKNVLRIDLIGQNWDFAARQNVLYYINSTGKPVELTGTQPREHAAGPRFIKERTTVWPFAVSMIREKPWTGLGGAEFRDLHEADPVARYSIGLDPSLPEDDPRSLYLYEWMKSGCIPLAAAAAVFIFYIAGYTKKLHEDGQADSEHRHHKAAILAALLGLMISGFADTPQPGTLPLYMMLLGTGLAADY